MINPDQSVAGVILAFSRFDMLRRLVEALRLQTRKPDAIIVIDQGTNEGIHRWLAEQHDLVVIRQANKGSAGGFSTGIQESIRRGHEWAWIFDDDAIPEKEALQRLVECPYFARENVAFLSSRIVDPRGKTYQSLTPVEPNNWYGTVLEDGCVQVNHATWLGLLVHSDAVREFGLPIEEFFLWEEDVEFTGRLARSWKAYCVLTSVIVHHQRGSFSPFDPTDFVKFSYMARNRIARAKIEPGPAFVRLFRTVRAVLKFVTMVAKREAPPRTLAWVFRGLFLFWPRVRKPGAPDR